MHIRTPNRGNLPPHPRPVRWWNTLPASLAGRRDARSAALPDASGHLPFTRGLSALAHGGHTNVDTWLRNNIAPIDRNIAIAAEAIAASRRGRQHATERLGEEEQAIAASTSKDEAVRHAREADRLRNEREQERLRGAHAAAELAERLALRRHVLDHARSAAAAWQARFNRLVASHRRGYLRRRSKATNNTDLSMPSLPSYLEWTSGDLPLLSPLIDPDARLIVELAMTPFDDRTTVSTGY